MSNLTNNTAELNRILAAVNALPEAGEGGAAIIDVVELPTENIREDAFYRLVTGLFVYMQLAMTNWTCYCVDSLPETGESCLSGDLTDVNNVIVTAYYNVSDGGTYAYVTTALSAVFGFPVGWYPVAALMTAVGYTFVGTITNITDDPVDGGYRLLLEYVIWQYKDGWVSLKSLGWTGTGASSEVFNHPSNIASGIMSHAEGYNTTASGYSSHAEGCGTTASGDYSHAEGADTTASVVCSHAEGYNTTASGNSSHAEGCGAVANGDFSHSEGSETTASGNISHAEGRGTIAAGDIQHVQGEFNIEDPDGKYAHIVGNGDLFYSRSNAHTLDWDGNAWFAGDVYVGGTGQDDPNAKKLATEELVGGKVSLPKTDGAVDPGAAGQFAVSDGAGGITWLTLNMATVYIGATEPTADIGEDGDFYIVREG